MIAWTHIISLKREDAARLGYDKASAWRDLLRAERNEIAAAMSIPADHFRWYAAFHDEGDHPHVHMMTWSSQSGEGWLDRDGIRSIRSRQTNQIFQQEMLHLYEQKTVSRDELVRSDGFPAFRIGSRIIVPKDKFIAWLDQKSSEKPNQKQ